MLGALLILLVIVNSFLCGVLLVRVKGLERTVAGVATVQRHMSAPAIDPEEGV